jgi:dolichol-phosphate mannosyltransferase
MKVSVIVPTYNERENIKTLVEEIDRVLGEDYEILVVDDGSADGTFELVQELARVYPIKPLKRGKKGGLASAIVYGFGHASGEIFGVIDADMQHPPEYMPQLINCIEEGYDVALASRYVDGGEVGDWSMSREFISKGARLLVRPLLKVKDPESGYFLLRRQVVQGVDFKPSGFKILLEILVKGKCSRVKEVPYKFKPREKGESKFGLGEVLNYVRLLGHLYWYRIRRGVE